MQEERRQTVLRCSHCKKPFDKESSLKRHGYYCRSRRIGIAPRPRSCVCCARSKARCDNKRPKCSRCVAKGTECDYPEKRTGPRAQKNDASPARDWRTESLSEANPFDSEFAERTSIGDDMILDNTLAVPDQELSNAGGRLFDWNEPNIDFTKLLDPPANNKNYPFDLSLLSFDQTLQLQQLISPGIPLSPTQNPRSIVPRPKSKTGTQRVADLLCHTLKSYLKMMRRNTLPPFIHPQSLCSSVENDYAEPLNNCISLMHMISGEVRGSRKLFWKNVRLECEQLYENCLNLNRWELLAAMQALSIYILMRLDEGETEHNNVDSMLVATVTVIAKQFGLSYESYNAQSALIQSSFEANWEDWIFEESKRRLCVIYQFVNMLFYFEPAALCEHPADVVIAPLPAKKLLWEATNEVEWRAELRKDFESRTAFGLAADGSLIRVDDNLPFCGHVELNYQHSEEKPYPRSTANWEEWCSGMDGMGGLVMLAASLIS